MPDVKSNVEIAHDVTKHGAHNATHRRHIWLGWVEAILLAVVAVATAWSGYQASRWDGISSTNFALYERYTVLSQEKSTLAGQDRLYDIVTFNGWVAAQVADRKGLAAFYERRFRPEYARAFAAWMKLDPFHNRNVPAGPIFMPQYQNANSIASDKFEAQAARYFDGGASARDRTDEYVRATVLLATVLFLTALSQRFTEVGPRAVLVALAIVLLFVSMSWLVKLPRA